MTLSEAWAELGLEPGTDADTARRTYLRLIKTRKPESDPEGFRRAREAWEAVRAAGEIALFAAESERRHAAPAPSANAGDVLRASPEAEPAPAPAAAESARERAEDPFSAFAREWRALPGPAGLEPRLDVARRAVAALPRDPRAYWLMVSTRSEVGTDAEIAEALRAGYRAGWIEFLQALLARVPELAHADEIEEALRSSSPVLLLLGAAALAPRDGARAVSVVVDFARAAQTTPTGEIPVARLLGVILALHESGDAMNAAAAHVAVAGLLHAQGLELELLRGPLGIVWTLVRELAVLPVSFPRALRRSFAGATRAGDLQSAFYDACFHARHYRGETVTWLRRTQRVAPNVSATLGAALARTRADEGQRRAYRDRRVWFVVPFVLALGRFLCSNFGTPTYTHVVPLLPANPATPVFSAPTASGSTPILSQAATELCGADWSGRDRLSCDDVRAALEALTAGECERAHTLIQALKLSLQGDLPTEPERRVLTGCDLSWWQRCGRDEPAPSRGGP